GAQYGAWLPWQDVLHACRLRLRPASRWQVFLAVWATSARYGGGGARLGVADIAAMTGLSARTVKSALAGLVQLSLVSRPRRSRGLAVHLPALAAGRPDGQTVTSPAPARGASKVALARCKQGCTSSTGIKVSSSSSKNRVVGPTFTEAQLTVVEEVLVE